MLSGDPPKKKALQSSDMTAIGELVDLNYDEFTDDPLGAN